VPGEENSGEPFTRSTHRQGHGVLAYRLENLTLVTQNYDVHGSGVCAVFGQNAGCYLHREDPEVRQSLK
jgi:hypothetical protein